MGNSESSNPIRNMDKRTARREYKDDFEAAIARYRQKHGIVVNKKGKEVIENLDESKWERGEIRVFVRKRPMFQHELDNSEFDVISCIKDKIIVHDARMHIDMKKQMLNHHEFQFDYVFNERSTNQTVYQVSTKPLVEIACEGGFSTALMYGQTGSGKTFTMSSIYTQAATEIFAYLNEKLDRFQKPPTVTVSFMEIAGDSIGDLLNGFQPTQLRSSSDGISVHPYPLTEPTVQNVDELMTIIQHGLNIRTTAATGVHDTSSRSHAILRIFIHRHDLVANTANSGYGGSGNIVEGTLTLVDLAGSEHRIDSMYHGKERRKETSYINASLMALKECIRARSLGQTQQHQHVYRKSKLTMALKTSFQLPHARTIVIATVSPASKDTEHSLNTLRHACIMYGQAESSSSSAGNGHSAEYVTGGNMTTEMIGEINIANLAKKNMVHKKEHGGIQELKTNNGNTADTKAARAANQEVELTEKMKRKMRRQSEAKSFNNLNEDVKEILRNARKDIFDQKHHALIRILGGGFQNGSNVIPMEFIDGVNGVVPIEEVAEEDEEDEEEENEDQRGKEEQSIEEEPILQQYRQPQNHTAANRTNQQGNNNHNSNNNSNKPTSYGGNPKPSKAHTNATAAAEEEQLQYHQHYYEEDTDFHPLSPVLPEPGVKKVLVSSPVKHLRRSASSNNATGASQTAVSTAAASSIASNIPYQTIYEAIFIAKDSVPVPILLMQLRAMLGAHHYTSTEIEYYIQQAKIANTEQQQLHSMMVTPPRAVPVIDTVSITQYNTNTNTNSSNTHQQQQHRARSLTPTGSTATHTRPQQHIMNVQGGVMGNAMAMHGHGNGGGGGSSNNNTGNNPSIKSKHVQNYYSKYDVEPDNTPQQQPAPTAVVAAAPHRRIVTNINKSQLEVLPSDDVTIITVSSSNTNNTYTNNTYTNNTNHTGGQQKVQDAKVQLEQEANLRKQRLENAKAFRDEMQKKKQASSASSSSSSGKVVHANSHHPPSNIAEMEEYEKEHLIAQYEQQISQLQGQLEEDRGVKNNSNADEKLSLATKFALKKQIAMIKANVLKLQRKSSNTTTTSSQGSTVAPATPPNPYDDVPLPTNKHQQQHQQLTSHSTPTTAASYPNPRQTHSDGKSNTNTNNNTNSYAQGGYYDDETAPQDNNDGDYHQHHMVSELGRPLSKRTAQNVMQRQQKQQQQQQQQAVQQQVVQQQQPPPVAVQQQYSMVDMSSKPSKKGGSNKGEARPPWKSVVEEQPVGNDGYDHLNAPIKTNEYYQQQQQQQFYSDQQFGGEVGYEEDFAPAPVSARSSSRQRNRK